MSILLCGLYITLNTQHGSLHSTLLSSDRVQLTQVADKELETTILELVANQAWDEALAEIEQLHNRVVSVSDKAAIARYDNVKTRMRAAARVTPSLERERTFLDQLAQRVVETAPDAFVTQLLHERILVDFRLIAVLDLHVAQQAWSGRTWSNSFYGSNEIDWFWKNVEAAQDYYSQFKEDDWQSRAGIPLDVYGNPVFFDVPSKYSETLGCGEKIMFLAAEIEQLDPTAEKHDAGRIMLYRARLAGRLFGPMRDPEWEEFTYDLNQRPSFLPNEAVKGMTPVNKLTDDETRIQVGLNLRQLSLPAQHSPLVLYRQLEQLYPNCDSVPRAMYEVGQFYQMRRQFSAAFREYERVLAKFPDHQRSVLARQQMEILKRPDVLLGRTGVYLPGSQPQVWFTYRNTAAIEFTLRRLNVERFLADQSTGEGAWRWIPTIDAFGAWGKDDDAVNNAGGVVASWRIELPESSMEAATGSTLVPHDKMGEYLLEARVPGTDEVSRAIILVTSVAIVHESQSEQTLLTLVDASTGERLPNETLRMIQPDQGTKKLRSVEYKSNEAGEVTVASCEEDDAFIYARTTSRGKAFLSVSDLATQSWTEPIVATYTATDRPVYRPGEVMQFRSWYRQQHEDDLLACPAVGTSLQIVIVGPDDSILTTLDLKSDETGSVDGAVELGSEAALGLYQVFVKTSEDAQRESSPYWMYYDTPSTRFRVEEYKRPEYRVSVAPLARTQSANDIAFQLEATYYFDDPVAAADVEYTLYRQFKRIIFTTPQPFDWLYGAGYGRYSYLYPWLGDTTAELPDSDANSGWGSTDRRGEEVGSGTTKLDAKGRAVVRFDASQLVPPSNDAVQFTLSVGVRDDSRRSITAEGTTIVATKTFFTFAELDRGWYKSGDPVQLTIATRDANSLPMPASVSVELSKVGPVNLPDATVSPELIDVQSLATADEGIVSVTFADLPVGQYRAIVQADDGAGDRASIDDPGNEFAAAVNFVVYGDQLNDQRRRYGDLELIPNARTYQPGDTARILVNTNQPPLQLSLEDSLGVRRTFDLAEQSSVIEIPIISKNSPSTLFRASAVRDGKFFTERLDLFIPPVDRMLQVAVNADARKYEPGSEATVRVAVTDDNGDPVSGDVVLAAYDASVLAIQPELGIGPKQMFLATKPSVWTWDNDDSFSSSLGSHQFESSGDFLCPEYAIADEYFYGPWSADARTGQNTDPDDITTRRGVGLGGSAPEAGDFTPTAESGAAQQSKSTAGANETQSDDDEVDPNAARRQFVPPVVRQDFSASAAWLPHLRLDDQGKGEAKFPLPDSLTTWKLRAFSITPKTQLGDGSGLLLTSKPLLVRLQTPRFLIDQDQVVVSANVHNGLATEKDVRVELSVPESRLHSEDATDAARAAATKDGLVILVREGRIAAGESQRFDWKLRAIQPGTAKLTVKALTDEASDAMAGDLPIIPFAMSEHKSQSLALKPGDSGEFELSFDLPEDLLAGSLSVELSATGSPANALFEAIPFLIDYPYGCVEQTMSRFYPLAIATDALRRLDAQAVDLKQPAKSGPRGMLRPGIRRDALLSSEEIERIADLGLQRLYRFQHQDGGWGWWEDDSSTPFMTAYVLVGLNTAAKAGIEVRGEVINRGRRYLSGWFTEGVQVADSLPHAQSLAYMVYALALPWDAESEATDHRASEITSAFDILLKRQSELNHYGHCLLALSLQNAGKTRDAQQELQKLLGQVQVNEETATLSVDAAEWWRWWNSDVETNAWLLRALVAIDPDNPLAEKVVQGLVTNRMNGSYWRSTRDSALAVLALSEYMVHENILSEHIEFNYALDNLPTTKVNARDLPLHPDNHLQLDPAALKTGWHSVRVSKPEGNHLHLNLTVEYQRIVDTIPAVRDRISIERTYRRIKKSSDASNLHASGDSLDTFEIGDIIEVELRIRTEQAYEYLAFEDPKPAGCEPLQLRSGSAWGNGLWGNVELRDQKVVFFSSSLGAGEHVLKYKLRAETPGIFRAMPATGFAMYTPEIRGSTTEQTIVIHDK
ncbi:MAG: hypothetical protein IT422_02100 [Pirellulaceae bacterium]|nr:hypothetical protein [Pirellulaceae bacterium]